MEVTNYTEALKLLYPNTFIPVLSNMTQDALINYVFMNPPDSFKKIQSLGRMARWSDDKLWFTQGEKEKWFRVFDEKTGEVKIKVIQAFLEWVKEEEKSYFDTYVSRIFSIELNKDKDITSFDDLREKFVTCRAATILSSTIAERDWSMLTYRLGERVDVHGTTVIDCADSKKWVEELINYQTMITKAIELHKRLGVYRASLTPKGIINLCDNVFIVTAETDVEDAFNSITKVCEYLEVIKKATLQPSSELKLTQGYGLTWRDLHWPDLRREDPASVAEQINDKLNNRVRQVPTDQAERLLWLLYPLYKTTVDNERIRLEDAYGLVALLPIQEKQFWRALHKFRDETRQVHERGFNILKNAGYKPNLIVYPDSKDGRLAAEVQTLEGRAEFYVTFDRNWHTILSSFNEFLEEAEKKVISRQAASLVVEAETISDTKTVLQKTWNNAHYGANITAAGTANKAAVNLLLPLLGDKQKAAVQFIGPMLVQWAALRVKNEQVSNILSAAADFAQIHLGTQLVEATFNLLEKQGEINNDLLLTEDTLQDIEHIHIKEGVTVK